MIDVGLHILRLKKKTFTLFMYLLTNFNKTYIYWILYVFSPIELDQFVSPLVSVLPLEDTDELEINDSTKVAIDLPHHTLASVVRMYFMIHRLLIM